MGRITVLSHNVFWFQGMPFATDQPPAPDPAVLSGLCHLYRTLEPDVVCLQEVQSREAFEMVAQQLEMEGCWSAGVDLPQYGAATFWHPGCGKMLTDAHRSSLEVQRIWQTAEVSAGESVLTVANLHLPSARQLGDAGAAKQRLAELQDVLTVRAAGYDLIAGDLNEQPDGDLSSSLKQQGYVDLARTLPTAPPTTFNGGRGDYLWLNGSSRWKLREFTTVCRETLVREGNGRYLSDHLPLLAVIED